MDLSKKVTNKECVELMSKGLHNWTSWRKCYSIELVRTLLDSFMQTQILRSEDIYYSFMFAMNAKTFKTSDVVMHHYMTDFGVSARQLISPNWFERLIFSLTNIYEGLKEYCANNKSEFVGAVENLHEYMGVMCTNMCLEADMSYCDRVTSARMIDEAFGSDCVNRLNEKYKRLEKLGRIRGIEKYAKLVKMLKSIKRCLH